MLARDLDHDVDVVVMNGAAPDLAHRVLRDGALVLERDRDARIEGDGGCRRVREKVEPAVEARGPRGA